MNQEEFHVETGLVLKTCPVCGIHYAVPSQFDEKRRQDHRSFHCPNGHSLSFRGETPEERRIRRLSEELNHMVACCDRERNKARMNDYRARHWKGRVTRLRRGEKGKA
jgi:hypothetical protein